MEKQFQTAIKKAVDQNALSLELRAATSLVRFHIDQKKSEDAKLTLQPVYDRFTEGFETQDLLDAKSVLQDL